jgi:hypothetical protein
MSEDTRRVLDLLSQGKITVEEADQLLAALKAAPDSDAAPPKPDAADSQKPRYLRIAVRKTRSWPGAMAGGEPEAWAWPGYVGKAQTKEVNIRVPLSVVRGGMRLGAIVPGLGDRVTSKLREQGIDLDLAKMDAAQIEALLRDLGDMTIDVDEGRHQVRISCE